MLSSVIATSSPGLSPLPPCITWKPPVLSFFRFQIGVFFPSRVQVGLKSARAVAQLVESRAVYVDDKNRGLPVDRDGSSWSGGNERACCRSGQTV